MTATLPRLAALLNPATRRHSQSMNKPIQGNRRALLVAFHFPPIAQSSGVHRAKSLARYLPEFGWSPLVLTATKNAYEVYHEGNRPDFGDDVVVRRALAFDTARHFAIAGRYPGFLANPDRWMSWWPFAIARGWQMIRKYRPSIVWSTYPVATAHVIGAHLAKLAGIPWVADFRDSMTDETYPAEPAKRKKYEEIEARTVSGCDRAVFTAPGALEMYRERFPNEDDEKWQLVLNGYDEETFLNAEATEDTASSRTVLLHSGIIYPKERNPVGLFDALSQMKRRGAIDSDRFELRLRAPSNTEYVNGLVKEYDLGDLVTVRDPVPYEQAVSEMLAADGLLILQSEDCNHQIPAKIYEYMRAQKPILALTDPTGDTAGILRQSGARELFLSRLDSAAEIEAELQRFIDSLDDPAPGVVYPNADSFSRRSQVGTLAGIFDELARL